MQPSALDREKSTVPNTLLSLPLPLEHPHTLNGHHIYEVGLAVDYLVVQHLKHN